MKKSDQLHVPVTTLGERAPGTHWLGDYVGPEAVMTL
jgi:hypothetical protein